MVLMKVNANAKRVLQGKDARKWCGSKRQGNDLGEVFERAEMR